MPEIHFCQQDGLKVCRACGNNNPDDFYWKKQTNQFGKRYAVRTALCKKCHNKRTVANLMKRRPAFILASSRMADKRRGHQNDLTQAFIAEQIFKPCAYCGNTEMLMTLDRIDNAQGHLQVNVVPACIRCNIARRDMPYAAWLEVARGMKRAFELGLFGDWVGAKIKTGAEPQG